jgi:hypothetical protein
MPLRRPRTLAAFSAEEYARAHDLLAGRVAAMLGRKFEEGDWQVVYCNAKNFPIRGWSNLDIDVVHGQLGVEHKMLGQSAGSRLLELRGKRLMHPAATRSIRIPDSDDPQAVMHEILNQYAELIEERRKAVGDQSEGRGADMRVGWLMWERTLREFLYFEEEMLAPDPNEYYAEWKESRGGRRKPSRNLWIYERETEIKRFSVTTVAGAKIQPYFDVPPAGDPNLYHFRVQSERVEDGVQLWVMPDTPAEVGRLIGDLSAEALGAAIQSAADSIEEDHEIPTQINAATRILLSAESFDLLVASFPFAVSDEDMFRSLARRLRHLPNN